MRNASRNLYNLAVINIHPPPTIGSTWIARTDALPVSLNVGLTIGLAALVAATVNTMQHKGESNETDNS